MVVLRPPNVFQIHRTDYLNGGTALHFAALHGHARCLRLVLADYVPSIPNFLNQTNQRSSEEVSDADFDDEYVGSLSCFSFIFLDVPCSDIPVLAVAWSRW
jgi:hypothetical protein